MIPATLARSLSFHCQLHSDGGFSFINGLIQLYFKMWSHGAPLGAIYLARLPVPTSEITARSNVSGNNSRCVFGNPAGVLDWEFFRYNSVHHVVLLMGLGLLLTNVLTQNITFDEIYPLISIISVFAQTETRVIIKLLCSTWLNK